MDSKERAKKNGQRPADTKTKREEFAKAAMQGLLAMPRDPRMPYGELSPPEVAKAALRCADALLLALEEGE